MRKGLFAVILVAASFAGGAVVNGPGLRWAQAMILNRPEGVEVVAPEAGAPPTAAEPAPSEPIPSAPIPPLVVEPGAPPKAARAANDAPEVPEPKAPAPPESELAAGRDGGPDRAKPPEEPLRRLAAPPDLLPPLESPAELTTPRDREVKEAGRPWVDMPGSAPAAAIPPRPIAPAAPEALAPPEKDGASAGRAPRDWAEVRRAMHSLGVGRYGIDGEPGGRVRFHCVIPLAGRRAVGQHFEAEADDELQAAQIALRRVALWRATEGPAR